MTDPHTQGTCERCARGDDTEGSERSGETTAKNAKVPDSGLLHSDFCSLQSAIVLPRTLHSSAGRLKHMTAQGVGA